MGGPGDDEQAARLRLPARLRQRRPGAPAAERQPGEDGGSAPFHAREDEDQGRRARRQGLLLQDAQRRQEQQQLVRLDYLSYEKRQNEILGVIGPSFLDML